MCRLFGCRTVTPGAVAHELLHGANALRIQSREHPDGWGLGWYVGRVPQVVRSLSAAHGDEDFEHVGSFVTASTILAHLRKASVGAVSLVNTHPFEWGPWLFAHNGTISDWRLISPAVETRIDAGLRAKLRGETDSERCFYLFLTCLADRCDPTSATFAHAAAALDQAVGGQRGTGAVGPLAQRGRGRRDEVVESKREQFRGPREPVEIEMLQGDLAAPVEIGEREARRGRGFGAGAFRGPAHEQRLARSQLTHQGDEVALTQRGSEPSTQLEGRRRRGQREGQRPHRRNTRGKPTSAMSLATSPVSPVRRAARSPARACRNTASRARSPVLPPPERRASTAAVIPVSTSPAPAVAMPGFPCAHTAEVPSGPATTVRAPLRTTQAPKRLDARTAASMRSDPTRSTSSPVSLENSPGCGVRTGRTGALRSRSAIASRSSARAFKASASSTVAQPGSSAASSSPRSCPVCGPRGMPGPIANAVFPRKAARSGARSPGPRGPFPGSGMPIASATPGSAVRSTAGLAAS